MRLSIFGLGHVGLTLAACLADSGFQVLGYDVDDEKIQTISNGRAPFYEPGLDILIGKAISSKRLRLVSDPEEAVLDSDITFITVGTPEKSDGSVDLTYVNQVLKSIGLALGRKREYHLVVLRSTVPPGTSREAVKALERVSGKKSGKDFGFCFNPEFLREGNAVQDTLHPDRIIIGELDEKSGNFLKDFYRRFYSGEVPPILRTTLDTAELIKYAANAFLAMKVSFINMIARLCEKIPHADVEVVARGIGLDKRIGAHFLKAGLGFGGSCFPKDLKALLAFAKRLNVRLPLVEATLQINEDQPLRAVQMAEELLGDLKGKRVAILGLAFKPNTNDMRNAVSIKLINELLKRDTMVVAYDPAAIDNAKRIFGNKIRYAKSARECLRGAEAAIIVTEWDEFKQLTPDDFIKCMKHPIMIDGRRIYDPDQISIKLTYKAIGLGPRYLNPAKR